MTELRPTPWIRRPRWPLGCVLGVPVLASALAWFAVQPVQGHVQANCIRCGSSLRLTRQALFGRFLMTLRVEIEPTEPTRFLDETLGFRCRNHRWGSGRRIFPDGTSLMYGVIPDDAMQHTIRNWDRATSDLLRSFAEREPTEVRCLVPFLLHPLPLAKPTDAGSFFVDWTQLRWKAIERIQELKLGPPPSSVAALLPPEIDLSWLRDRHPLVRAEEAAQPPGADFDALERSGR